MPESTPYLVAVCGLLAGLAATAPPAAAQRPPARVTVSEVHERDVAASMRLVGTVLAQKEAVVAAEVAGIVAEFPATEGQFLDKGEVICRLDDTPTRLRLAEAKGRLGKLQAELEELENGTRPETIKQLEAAVGEAKARYDLWKFERDRVRDLFDRNQANPKEMNDAEMELLAAERRLEQVKAALEQAENGPRKEEIDAARHDVAAQQAIAQQLERDLEKTEIRAPFDGFITAKHTEVGEWIEVGGPVSDMVLIETVKVRVDVPERAVPFCRPGQPATVEVEALDERHSAPIARVVPRAAPSARTFPVEIDLDNSEHTLLPGMFVWTYVPAGPPGKRLMVNRDAIVPSGRMKQLFVVRPGQGNGHMAVPMTVETGLELDGEVAVRAEGLQAGDTVVIRGNERIYGPTPVIPEPAEPPTASRPAAPTVAGETAEAGEGS